MEDSKDSSNNNIDNSNLSNDNEVNEKTNAVIFEELDVEETSDLNISERNAFFQKGLLHEQQNNPDTALKCYLKCLKGLGENSQFFLLPQCLHNIAEIYNVKKDYQNAIHFAQAEKLFYETALVESSEIRKKLEEIVPGNEGIGDVPLDINDLNIDAMRADEFEQLARLCLDKHQAQLALEYAGKCTKLRQRVFGDNHQKTKDSLNFFASIYAEAGKLQYSDSMDLLETKESNNNAEGLRRRYKEKVPQVVKSKGEKEPVSILRQRSTQSDDEINSSTEEREKKQVRFHQSVDESMRNKKKEEMVSLAVTMLMLCVMVIVLGTLGIWLYCSIDRNHTCRRYTARLHSYFLDIQYWLFHS